MRPISTRQFSVLSDFGKIYQFMLEIYERDWRCGVPAPFFEYACSSFASWMDLSYSYKTVSGKRTDRLWDSAFMRTP